MGLDFMFYFNILIAIYVLYYAFRGKGRIYEVDYPEEARIEYCRMLRLFCWVVGIFMLVLSIAELILYNTPELYVYSSIVSWINIICVLVAVVVFIIVTKKKFGKYQK